jgi:hypothetical protein
MSRFPDMVSVVGAGVIPDAHGKASDRVLDRKTETGHPEFLMVQVVFTPNLQRHVTCPPVRVTAGTVAEALECVFSDNPVLRSYVLDDQGALRKNMVIFVDGRAMKDRYTLGDSLDADAEVFVMQALTGG